VDHDKIRTNLSAYKDGELDEALRDQVARHLQVCDACREELRELDQIDLLVRGLPELAASETFTSEIIARTQSAKAGNHLKMSLLRRISGRFLNLADSVFQLLPGYVSQRTGSLDEFGDFPPLSLSYAYFQLIGK
jgi:anti-sigma factor RsiW